MSPPIPLLVNGAAGAGRAGRQLDALLTRLDALGILVEPTLTRYPGHATALARGLAHHPVVLVAGGDGTTFEALNGVMLDDVGARRASPPALGLLPLGTGNSFLRDLGISSLEQALTGLDAALAGGGRRVDVVHATTAQRPFVYLNLLGLGFAATVGALTNRVFKPLGPAGYALATLVEVARLQARPFPRAADDGPRDDRDAVLLSFSNSQCTAGTMRMAPEARIDDGLLDIIRIGALGRLALLRAFPKIYAGTHVDHPAVESDRAREVVFHGLGEEPLMVDGEVFRGTLQKLTVWPSAVEVLA